MPQAPVILNGRTVVPLRFISESSGKTVHWDDFTKMIIINDGIPFKKGNFKAPSLSLDILNKANMGRIGDFHIDEFNKMTMAKFVHTYGFPDYRHDGTPESDDIPFISYGDYFFDTTSYRTSGRKKTLMISAPYVAFREYITNNEVVSMFGYPDGFDEGLYSYYIYNTGRYQLYFNADSYYYDSEVYGFFVARPY